MDIFLVCREYYLVKYQQSTVCIIRLTIGLRVISVSDTVQGSPAPSATITASCAPSERVLCSMLIQCHHMNGQRVHTMKLI